MYKLQAWNTAEKDEIIIFVFIPNPWLKISLDYKQLD